jgi:hypothetical protein
VITRSEQPYRVCKFNCVEDDDDDDEEEEEEKLFTWDYN